MQLFIDEAQVKQNDIIEVPVEITGAEHFNEEVTTHPELGLIALQGTIEYDEQDVRLQDVKIAPQIQNSWMCRVNPREAGKLRFAWSSWTRHASPEGTIMTLYLKPVGDAASFTLDLRDLMANELDLDEHQATIVIAE